MTKSIPHRSEISSEDTIDLTSIFPSDEAWEAEMEQIVAELPQVEAFRGRLGKSPEVLADWMETSTRLRNRIDRFALYARLSHHLDTTDQEQAAKHDRGATFQAHATAKMAFAEAEIVGIGFEQLRRWAKENPRLAVYAHYFEQLEKEQFHIRSGEIEELLGQIKGPSNSAIEIHSTLANADLAFRPAQDSRGETVEVAHGNISDLLTNPDRELRRTAWESYADGFLAVKNTMAACVATLVKQHVFVARARVYDSTLEAALAPRHITPAVFHNLIETFLRHLPTWHRYWRIKRRALGYDRLYAYDDRAQLAPKQPSLPFEQAVEWVAAGMQPLGDGYVSAFRRGVLDQRWVDRYPNQGKHAGAYSSGVPGTHPFILMNYGYDIFGMSTLAHELGHSMHSYLSWQTQPLVYARHSAFLSEVASNFNQALVRAYLLESNPDVDFQIALIDETMANFYRYFFLMPTLARFELAVHERVEQGQGLNAEGMIDLMAELFREGYGGEVEVDEERVGITWAQFPLHLRLNYYVFQYATGLAAAQALAEGVLEEGVERAERYLAFLGAGGSGYPLDILRQAGVDMTSPEPVEQTFGVLARTIDRLEALI
jgi:oligoendopeptidase F